ncbi:MAG: hypothetical protein KAH06_07980 [Desulfobacterales bacterium]|nr:hypothetical protein [Desulfobacterales bacterium]
MNFAHKLRDKIDRDVFSQQDLKALLSPMTEAAIYNGVTRSLKSGDFLKLKRGLYLFSKRLRRDSLSRFLIANKLYGPGYISFESALSYHGLIPEAVYSTTSACFQRKSKIFENKLGEFCFDYIPCNPFFMGVESVRGRGGVQVANAIRALFDLIYLRRKKYPALEDLQRDLRIERVSLGDEVKKFSVEEIEKLAQSYKKRDLTEFARLLLRLFK